MKEMVFMSYEEVCNFINEDDNNRIFQRHNIGKLPGGKIIILSNLTEAKPQIITFSKFNKLVFSNDILKILSIDEFITTYIENL